MGAFKELAGSSITCAAGGSTSNLASGAAVAATAGGGNLTNSSGLNFTAIARLVGYLGGYSSTQGSSFALFLVPKADGSTVASTDTSTPYLSPNYLVGNFYWPLTSAGSSDSPAVMDIPAIPLEAYDYEPVIVNNTDETLEAGWSLTFYPTQNQSS